MNFIDLTGKQFGKLTVIAVSETRLRNVLSWECTCECGNSKIVAGVDLRTGSTTSCGCMHHKGKQKDISGQKKGSLTAVSSTGEKTKNGDYKWNFICDCGNTVVMSLGYFSKRNDLSCKYCTKEKTRRSRIKHGFNKNHKTYKVWFGMKDRCFNTNSPNYKDYGAKGISVDPYFVEDFMNFYNEIGEAPDDGQKWSLDRIDYTKNYEPGNIRWATDCQQARNRGKHSSNSSGVAGVHFYNHETTGGNFCLYAVATWKEFKNGKNHARNKKFSVLKHGLLPAFTMACQYREDKIKELNEQGYGYSENHGK